MHSKYKSLSEWSKKNQNAYTQACIHGLLDVICEKFGWERNPNNRKPSGYWTLERCIEEALKYKTINEWKLNSQTTFYKSKKLNIFDDCSKHMVEDVKEPRKPAGYWHDKKNCMKEAKKYDSTYDWYKHSPQSLLASIKINYFTQCTKHMSIRVRPFSKCRRTRKKCLEEASNYSSLKSWKKLYPISYCDAQKYGWLNYISKKLWK